MEDTEVFGVRRGWRRHDRVTRYVAEVIWNVFRRVVLTSENLEGGARTEEGRRFLGLFENAFFFSSPPRGDSIAAGVECRGRRPIRSKTSVSSVRIPPSSFFLLDAD
jgi:hypothetical protein